MVCDEPFHRVALISTPSTAASTMSLCLTLTFINDTTVALRAPWKCITEAQIFTRVHRQSLCRTSPAVPSPCNLCWPSGYLSSRPIEDRGRFMPQSKREIASSVLSILPAKRARRLFCMLHLVFAFACEDLVILLLLNKQFSVFDELRHSARFCHEQKYYSLLSQTHDKLRCYRRQVDFFFRCKVPETFEPKVPADLTEPRNCGAISGRC